MLLSMLSSMAMVVMIKAGRTQLGATTVLAVVTIGFGGKAKPQVKLYPFLPYICVHSIHIYNLLFNFKNLLMLIESTIRLNQLDHTIGICDKKYQTKNR